MTLQTFHLFPALPKELRDLVWLHALPPPRIIGVEETFESLSHFEKRTFGKEIDDGHVHPDLEYFGIDMMAPMIQEFVLDNGLDVEIGDLEHGAEPKPQTGKGKGKEEEEREFVPLYLRSTETHYRQGITPSRLFDPLLYSYYQATRRGSLYSHSSIPSLLKTCRDSRSCMQRLGYTLTFSTRTSPPRIWFNYTRDILFLRALDSDINEGIMSELVDGTGTNIGQFRPAEFTQVRRLALDFSKWISWDEHWQYEILRVVRLFRNLDELFLVLNCDWWFQDIRGGFITGLPKHPTSSSASSSPTNPYFSPDSASSRPFPIPEHWKSGGGIDWTHGGGTTLKTPANSSFPWGFRNVENEGEFWKNYVTPTPGTFALTNDGNYRFKIKEFERRGEGNGNRRGERRDFFGEWKREVEESLREKWEEDRERGGREWKVPKIRLVFLRQEEGLDNV
ncbi:hypothetical protein EAF00_004554 [Botryotinia globosa]|nr:hypothetical protein EAF00_004554 [Botryotinia globosa]